MSPPATEQAVRFLPVEQLLTSYAPLRPGAPKIPRWGLADLPLRVAPAKEPGTYEVIDGFKRLRRFQEKGRPLVPVVIETELSIWGQKQLLLKANAPPRTTTPLDEARVVCSFVEDDHHTPTQVARMLGRKLSWVEGRMDLLRLLSPDAQAQLAKGRIGPTVAQALTTLSHRDQAACLATIDHAGLTASESLRFVEAYQAADEADRKGLLRHGLQDLGESSEPPVSVQAVLDNMTTAVLGRIGPERKPLWHPRFLDFARHYGFTPYACAVRDPNRKGKKEKSFRLVWDDFLNGSEFASCEELDERRRVWLDETPDVANLRVHGTTHRVPNHAFHDEHPFLIRLPDSPFPVNDEEIRQVDRDSTIWVRGTPYSVPSPPSTSGLSSAWRTVTESPTSSPPRAGPRTIGASMRWPWAGSSIGRPRLPTTRSRLSAVTGPLSSATSIPVRWTPTARSMPSPHPPLRQRRPLMARSSRRAPVKDPTDELRQLAIDLDLTALADALPLVLDRAEREGLSFSSFALTLFGTEIAARKSRSLTRSLRRSRLGPIEGLDGFDFAARPQLDPRIVRELMNCRFVEEHRNVLCPVEEPLPF